MDVYLKILPFNKYINGIIINYLIPDLIELSILEKIRDSKYCYYIQDVESGNDECSIANLMNVLRKDDAILTGSFLLFILGYVQEYHDIDMCVENKNIGKPNKINVSNICTLLYHTTVHLDDSISDLPKNLGANDPEWFNFLQDYPIDLPDNPVRFKDYYRSNGLNPIYYEKKYQDYSFSMPYEHYKLFDYVSYSSSNISKYIYTIREYNLHTTKLQIIETHCDPRIIIDMFDFNFCKLYYSFKDRKLVYINEHAVKNRIHIGPIDELKTSIGRRDKYSARGYRFIEDKSI
jgi:hypothetical protein